MCRRITGQDADAADAAQEALLAVVRGLPRFDGRSKFSTWVHRIAHNACIDELRRRGRRPDPGLPDHETRPRGEAPAVDDAVTDRLAVDEALQALPEDYRVVVVLRDQLGLDYAEIAEVVGIPPGTVRSRIARGRAALARQLGNRSPSGDVEETTP